MTTKAPGVLARLFSRKPDHPFIGDLYARAFGVPLLIDGVHGANLIEGYLRGGLPTDPFRAETDYSFANEQGIAVLDVAGGLVFRSGGICSPQSYEEIGQTFASLVDDPAVGAIVLRMDSPGGEANGMFDLADQIHAARGTKPIVAMVDRMAYSAGYGIASAADEIWITRTAGVGAIGAVLMLDKGDGSRRVEVIESGEFKTALDADGEVKPKVRAELQDEINRLGDMFHKLAARNRGVSVATIRDMQARNYHGERAIRAKLADKLGTFPDLIDHLAQRLGAPKPAASSPSTRRASALAHTEAGMVAEPLDYVPTGPAPTQTQAADDYAAAVSSLCAAARVPDLAADFMAMNAPVETVRRQLMDLAIEGEEEIITARGVPLLEEPRTARLPSNEEVYRRRRVTPDLTTTAATSAATSRGNDYAD